MIGEELMNLKIIMMVSLFALCSCASTSQNFQAEEEKIGHFYEGMPWQQVQDRLNQEGKAIFYGLYKKHDYAILFYSFHKMPKSYVFAFRDGRLVAIMEPKIFHEAWQESLKVDECKIPFSQGLESLYSALVKRKDKIIHDHFVDVDLNNSVPVSSESAGSAGSSVAEALAYAPLIAVMAPAIPVGIGMMVILHPLQKLNEKQRAKRKKALDSIHLGSKESEVNALLGEPVMYDKSSGLSVYGDGSIYTLFGIRNGYVQWITTEYIPWLESSLDSLFPQVIIADKCYYRWKNK